MQYDTAVPCSAVQYNRVQYNTIDYISMKGALRCISVDTGYRIPWELGDGTMGVPGRVQRVGWLENSRYVVYRLRHGKVHFYLLVLF